MKYATFSKSAFAVTAILLAVACADDAEPEQDLAAVDPATDVKATPPATKKDPPPAAEKKCPSSCKVNSDCASACPALPDAVQCCSSGQCYAVKGKVCTAPKEPTQPDGTY